MLITVITNASLKAELQQQLGDKVLPDNVVFVSTIAEVNESAAVVIDLLFDNKETTIHQLQSLPAELIVVNATIGTLQQLPANFARINAWPTFLQRSMVEAAVATTYQAQVQEVFALFNKTVQFTPDVPGFITARVVAAIINEAYLSLAEELSTKAEIDTAMKMGTNYPYGPFEWAKKIGHQPLADLLQTLAIQQGRYTVAPLLLQEINA